MNDKIAKVHISIQEMHFCDYLLFNVTAFRQLASHLPAAGKAESCSDCNTYLKVIYPEYDRESELVADDLVSLALDAEMEREGFSRSGINPFFFPG